MTQTYVFGGQPVQPSNVSYSALALAADTELQWPWVDQDTDSAVPLYLYVTPTGAYSITMPDATGASTGQAVIIFNVGASTITILDNAAGAITTITAGVAKYVILRDNSTAAGTWQSLTFGAGSNAVDAAALAGYGLSALSGATLNSNSQVSAISGDVTASASYRAQVFEVTSATGAGTLSFDSVSTLGNGWWMGFSNLGSGAWTLDPNGTEQIDGQSTIVLNPTETCLIFSSGSALYTIGRGRSVDFVYTALNKDVAGNTDVTLTSTEASNLLIKLFGILTGNINLIVPSVVNEYMIRNATTGAYTVTVKTAAGSGVVATQGEQAFIKCDGTDCFNVVTNIPVSGTYQMQDGSASLPGLAFENETTTGFFRSGSGVMGLSVLASQVMGWTSSATTSYVSSVVKSTNAGATVGPTMTLWRDSASPADNDVLGGLNFDGEDDGSAQTTYASVQATALDVTDGTEDGTLDFHTMNAGTLAKRAFVGQGLVVGSATDAGAGAVSAESARVTSTDAGAALGPTVTIYRNSATPAASDLIGAMDFSGEDSAGNETVYAEIVGRIDDPTNTTELGSLIIRTMADGSLADTVAISKTQTKITYTDAGASSGPSLVVNRISGSPAANDVIGVVSFDGSNDGAAQATYGSIRAEIGGAAAGNEIGSLIFRTAQFAGPGDRLTVGAGVQVGAPTGGDKGAGTLNATALYINGTAVAQKTVQVVDTLTGAVATGTTVIPLDDSIPQNTEGDEYMTRAITPTNASNTLRIDVVCNVSHSANSVTRIAALFQDSTANSLAVASEFEIQNSQMSNICFTHWMTAGTTSSTTFKVRAGASSAGTMTFNGSGGSRLFGGVMASSITITEYA